MFGKFSSNCTSTTAPITATIRPFWPFPIFGATGVDLACETWVDEAAAAARLSDDVWMFFAEINIIS